MRGNPRGCSCAFDSVPPWTEHASAHNKRMRFLYFLADMFIDGFGITRPTEKTRTQAAFFILALLILTLAGMVAAGLAIRAVVR